MRNKIIFAGLILLFTACRKDEKLNVQQPVGLGGDVTVQTSIDKWILDSLTTPYNIAVKYRWDPYLVSEALYRLLTPTDESRVIPLLSALNRAWILPFNAETGSNAFMKTYTPKQLTLIGSVEYDEASNLVLGQAEGGNQIAFFDVNQHAFPDARTSFSFVLHAAHHEFAHSLNYIKAYQPDFIGTSAKLGLAGYTATWFNVAESDAHNAGYATSYSMSNKDDDFVETVSIMLTEGRTKWEELKASVNTTARQALQQKEDYVIAYYKQSWNIDFYSLQTRVQAAISTLLPPPAVTAVFGYGLTYSTASVNPSNTAQLPLPAAFTSIFNASRTALSSFVSGGTSGRVLDSFDVYHYSPSAMLLECYFHTPAAPATQQYALYLYNYTRDAGGVYTFTLSGRDANGTTFATPLASLVNYMSNNKFTITWYADPNTSYYPRVKFTPQAIPGTYFLARLLP